MKINVHNNQIIYLIILGLSLFGFTSKAQTVMIAASSSWKYLDNGSNQGTSWRTGTFNDATWLSGTAELGFGDSPITNIAKSKIGYYFRKLVSISDPAQFTNFTLKVRRDDGIVVYVNNVEVYRNNMPSGTINYNTAASSTCSDDGNTVLVSTLTSSRFVSGNNLVAVEVHNRTASSSDLTFELQLIGNGSVVTTCALPDVNYFGSRNVTGANAEVYWNAVAGVSSYNVQYRIRNSGAAYSASLNTAQASLVLTNLLPSTNYEFIVQSVCSGGNVSAFSQSGWFTTGIATTTCTTPDVNWFGTRNITGNSAEVFWASGTGVASYNVAYRVRNSGAAYSTALNTIGTSRVLTNLTASTNYEFIVQALCSNGGSSAYSASGWFTTTSSGGGSTTTLVRGPYLTVATSNSITIQWRSGTATNNEVKYGTTTALSNGTATNAMVSTEHSVVLTGLEANTKYYYSIGQVGSVLQGDANNFFFTAPAVGSSVPVKFWVTGDFGNGSAGQTAVRNSFSTYTAGQTVNGWLWLGDNAYSNGTDQEYQTKVFDVYNSQFKNIPVFPAPGNHDYGQAGYQSSASLGVNFPYFNIFALPSAAGTEKYYSTNYGNIHFISLDSYGSYNNSSSAMYNWLRNDLISNTQQWTVVYFHHAPYTKGSHNSDTEIELIDMRQNIIPLLESYGVDLVLAGHSHIYERSYFIKNHTGLETSFNSATYPAGNIIQAGGGPFTKTTRTGNGTVYVVCGVSGQAGGATQSGYPHNAMFKSIISNYGSLLLDVSGSTLTCKFLTSTGSIGDQFTMQKTLNVPATAASTFGSGTEFESLPVLYPNPSMGDVSIYVNHPVETQFTVSICNLSGSVLFRKTYTGIKDQIILIEKAESNLLPGIYIINVFGENMNASMKQVIY